MAVHATVHRAVTIILVVCLSLVSSVDGYNLRILTVGDSITAGVGSSDGSGYRLDLENLLKAAGKSHSWPYLCLKQTLLFGLVIMISLDTPSP